MKTQRNILIAFILNLGFAIFEVFGGLFTGSVAILSDSIHDLGDSISIGASWFLEKKSLKNADSKYTFGYRRFSLLGAFVTISILVIGSVIVIYNSIGRLINPVEINYNGMIIMAVVGVIVNLIATFVTHEGDSANQKAVNLHMLEDVLTWVAVLIGAVIMRFTDLSLLDPLFSIGISLYILHEAAETGKEVLDVFLMKTPDNVDITSLNEALIGINGINNVNNFRVFSLSESESYAVLNLDISGDCLTSDKSNDIKNAVRDVLAQHNISNSNIEFSING